MKIFVFCNACSYEWHTVEALSAEGLFLAAHICSSHAFIRLDMVERKRDLYAAAYPEGFEVVVVDDPRTNLEVLLAHEKHLEFAKTPLAYLARLHEITERARIDGDFVKVNP
jgi:hypothetical protein